MQRLPFLLVICALLSACGGGGHGGPPTVPTAPIGSNAHKATFRITIPKAAVAPGAKRPATISPNTATIVLSVKSVNGVTPNPVPAPLTVSITDRTYCSGSLTGTTCNINYLVPIATSIVVQIQTFDASGKALGIGYVGPIDTTQPVTTPVGVALGGDPVTAKFTKSALSVANTGSTSPVSLSAELQVYDGEGNLLISPDTYGGSITIGVNNDTTHAIALSTTQLTAPDTTVGASNTVGFTYTSSNVLAPNVQLTATFNGATLATLPIVALTATPSTLPNLTVGGPPQTITVSEPLDTHAFTLTGALGAASVACSPATCMPSTPGGNVTINVTPSSAGSQTITIADANGTTVQIPVTVTGSSGGGGLVAPPYHVYEYPNPSGFSMYAANYDIAAGPDGNSVWFVDFYDQALGKVSSPGSCSNVTCSISEGYLYELSAPQPKTLAIGGDGAIYVNDNGNFDIPTFGSLLQQHCTGSGTLTCTGNQITPATVATAAPVDVKTAPDGNLYMTDGYSNVSPAVDSAILYIPVIGCCNPTNFQYFNVAPAPSSPNMMTVDTTGQYMFFTDTGNGTIGHFALNCAPSCSATESSFTGMSAPLQGIVEGSDGDLYVAEPNEHRIDRISAAVALSCTTSCAMQTITLPSGSAATPENLTIGPDGNVWFTDADATAGYVGFISLNQCQQGTCKAVEYPVPSAGSAPWGITAGPDGNIWFTESVPTGGSPPTGHIGEVQLQWLVVPSSRR